MTQLVRAEAFDFIGVLIFVGVVVAQIIKASKAQKPGRSTPEARNSTSGSPARSPAAPTALQELLQSLASTTSAPVPQRPRPSVPKPQPPSLPKPTPSAVVASPRVITQKPVDPEECDPYEEHIETPNAPKTVAPPLKKKAYATNEPHHNVTESGLSLTFLKQPDALKQAVLAHEILGPPRAFTPLHSNTR